MPELREKYVVDEESNVDIGDEFREGCGSDYDDRDTHAAMESWNYHMGQRHSQHPYEQYYGA